MYRDLVVARQDLLLPTFNKETSFDITNAPHIITLLRRVGLGFMPQPRDKVEKEYDEKTDDLDVGPVGKLPIGLDI